MQGLGGFNCHTPQWCNVPVNSAPVVGYPYHFKTMQTMQHKRRQETSPSGSATSVNMGVFHIASCGIAVLEPCWDPGSGPQVEPTDEPISGHDWVQQPLQN
eukprot:s374_g6.t1